MSLKNANIFFEKISEEDETELQNLDDWKTFIRTEVEGAFFSVKFNKAPTNSRTHILCAVIREIYSRDCELQDEYVICIKLVGDVMALAEEETITEFLFNIAIPQSQELYLEEAQKSCKNLTMQ